MEDMPTQVRQKSGCTNRECAITQLAGNIDL